MEYPTNWGCATCNLQYGLAFRPNTHYQWCWLSWPTRASRTVNPSSSSKRIKLLFIAFDSLSESANVMAPKWRSPSRSWQKKVTTFLILLAWKWIMWEELLTFWEVTEKKGVSLFNYSPCPFGFELFHIGVTQVIFGVALISSLTRAPHRLCLSAWDRGLHSYLD